MSLLLGLQASYEKAMEAGDYTVAGAVLEDSRFAGVVDLETAIREPVACISDCPIA